MQFDMGKGDINKIVQVLHNLINNAIKFTERGEVTVATTRDEGNIHVMVRDTGTGIRQEDMTKLFYAFERIDERRNNRIDGTGLGLVICKEIIEKHNGKIWAESEFGKGSTFHFVLPSETR